MERNTKHVLLQDYNTVSIRSMNFDWLIDWWQGVADPPAALWLGTEGPEDSTEGLWEPAAAGQEKGRYVGYLD